ncbi:hypothetical protein Acy02nite_86410 [Actinoplanes cyaneus]|uniref:Uncharacterized protein n=1 Tax=Actinoplanes cyaneus TaxID=52696 RepID=A0A919M5S0_9ACTN|nr:hypothetical protein [Actinoplanes cyaneus]GID70760.1 hypothetical protein Acy02nite_86410 [Actinoplanes cyaneus]
MVPFTTGIYARAGIFPGPGMRLRRQAVQRKASTDCMRAASDDRYDDTRKLTARTHLGDDHRYAIGLPSRTLGTHRANWRA